MASPQHAPETPQDPQAGTPTACMECGLIVALPALEPNQRAYCPRCESLLHDPSRGAWANRLCAASALGALVLYIPAITLPILTIERMGHQNVSSVWAGVVQFLSGGDYFVGAVVLICSVIIPVLKLFGLLLLVWGPRDWQPHTPRALVSSHRMEWQVGHARCAPDRHSGGLGQNGRSGLDPAGQSRRRLLLDGFPKSRLLRLFRREIHLAESPLQPVVPLEANTSRQSSQQAGLRMTDTTQPLPNAAVRSARSPWWFGWIPLIALGIATYMVYSSLQEKGLLVTVQATEGHGIRDGARVRYRGIDVGTVEEVRLQSGLVGVELMVRLDEDARELAQEGTEFWIVYPRVGLDGIQGLETVVGARYLAVAPAKASVGGSPQRVFQARSEPPVEEFVEEGGLEIVLDAPSKFGMERGAPVTYRGFWIGRVVSVELASDATVVEVTIRIAPEYRSLVRNNSVFWEESGIELDLSLTGGVTLDVGTLRSLLVGAVAMATPSYPGEIVPDGHRFALAAGAEKDWMDWRPALPIGVGALPEGLTPPKPWRAQITWSSGRILKTRNVQRAWVLPVAGGLLAPDDFGDQIPSDSAENLEIRIGDLLVNQVPSRTGQGSVRLLAWEDGEAQEAAWPAARMRRLGLPEDCMVYAGEQLAAQSVAAYRLLSSARGWEVSEDMRFSRDWHGAPVIARSDGALIGLLVVQEGAAHIAPLPGQE